MRLRYVGSAPTTFMGHGVGEVEPRQEFDVLDDAAGGFLARADIEQVVEAPAETVPDAEPDGTEPEPRPRKTAGTAKATVPPVSDNAPSA